MLSDGAVYAIPCDADHVLRIGEGTTSCTTSLLPIEETGGRGFDTRQAEKWEGGVLGEDGTIYCLPQAARRVLAIRPAGSGGGTEGSSFCG